MAKPKNPLKHEAEIGLLTGRLERQKETVKELRTQLKKDTHTIHQFRTENIRVQNELEAALARITRRDRTIKAMQERAKAQRDNHKETSRKLEEANDVIGVAEQYLHERKRLEVRQEDNKTIIEIVDAPIYLNDDAPA